MESILGEINAVLGVTGSFVCNSEGAVIGRAVPGALAEEQLALAARIAAQTFQAMELSGQRVTEMDLLFGQGRLILKGTRGGILAMLCARNVSLPLLNLSSNVALKKIAVELKALKPHTGARVPVPAPAARSAEPPMVAATPAANPAPAAPASRQTEKALPAQAGPAVSEVAAVGPAVAPPALAELSQELDKIFELARGYWLDLRVMDSLGVWLNVGPARAILDPTIKREIALAARSGRFTQPDGIESLFSQLGYTGTKRNNHPSNQRRFRYVHLQRDLVATVYLDMFEMYHRVDLTGYFAQEQRLLPETALLLTRLQFVEMTEAILRELSALLLERDLTVGREGGKIDASEITRLCAEDWGWFKTVSTNLDRVLLFAASVLKPAENAVVHERAQRLKKSITNAPKSLRWQTRARLGESVRWYETPIPINSGSRPEMAIG